MTDRFHARSLTVYVNSMWEGPVADLETARAKSFADPQTYGFAFRPAGGTDAADTLYYFGEVLTTEDAMQRRYGKEEPELAAEFAAANLLNGVTHFMISRKGNYGPLGGNTIVLDAATGTKTLWPLPTAP